MKEQIRLYREPGGWRMITDSPSVLELFGTDALPTAFTAQAGWPMVAERIRELNPEAAVQIHIPGTDQWKRHVSGTGWVPVKELTS